MMGQQADGYNPRGVELLCDIIRGQAASLPCPRYGQTLDDVGIGIREVADDLVELELTCRRCESEFVARATPASDGGVAVVR
jgi:hypothetical protein